MPFYIAADGGGTKTETVLVDHRGKIYAKMSAKGSNPYFMDREAAMDNLARPIFEMLQQSNLQIGEIEKIVLFVPGMRRYRQELAARLGTVNLQITGDETAAFYGAFGGKPGITVLAGTGSFAVGRNKQKESCSVGGWGPLFGDEGSGYDIGIMCLRAAGEQFDAGNENSSLADAVNKYFSLDSVSEIKARQNDTALFSREKIAGLCKIVSRCAKDGDEAALTIFDNAAEQLAKLALLCSRRLTMDSAPYPCALLGGVAKIGPPIKLPFQANLQKLCPNLTPTEPKFEPIVGAVLSVLEDNSVDISEAQLGERIALQIQNN